MSKQHLIVEIGPATGACPRGSYKDADGFGRCIGGLEEQGWEWVGISSGFEWQGALQAPIAVFVRGSDEAADQEALLGRCEKTIDKAHDVLEELFSARAVEATQECRVMLQELYVRRQKRQEGEVRP